MKNLKNIYKKNLLFFLSGIYLAFPDTSGAIIFENNSEIAAHGNCSSEKSRKSKSFSSGYGKEKLRNNKPNSSTNPRKLFLKRVLDAFDYSTRAEVSEQRVFLDREGYPMQFSNVPNASWVHYKKEDSAEFVRSSLTNKRLLINSRKPFVFPSIKKPLSGVLKGQSLSKRGIQFTANREVKDNGNIMEYGALLPLVVRNSGIVYLDLKSKFYDILSTETKKRSPEMLGVNGQFFDNTQGNGISGGVVLRKKVSPSVIGGVNAFTDLLSFTEGRYQWYSFGWEVFFKSLSLGSNYYISDRKGNLVTIKNLSLDPKDRSNSRILIQERIPADGFDFSLGLELNKYVALKGALFSFHSPHHSEESLVGFKVAADFLFYLNKRYAFSVRPEFSRDTNRDVFSINFGIKLPIGREYGDILHHVKRDRDMILFDSENSYSVKSVYLSGKENFEIREMIGISSGNQIKKPVYSDDDGESQLRTLYYISDKESNTLTSIVLPKEMESVIIADNMNLDINLEYNGKDKQMQYSFPRSTKTLTFGKKDGIKHKNILITGSTVVLDFGDNYTLTDVTFDKSDLFSNNEYAFINGENVRLSNSYLALGTHTKKAFYSDKNDLNKDGKAKVNYALTDVDVRFGGGVIYEDNAPPRRAFDVLVGTSKEKKATADVTFGGRVNLRGRPINLDNHGNEEGK